MKWMYPLLNPKSSDSTCDFDPFERFPFDWRFCRDKEREQMKIQADHKAANGKLQKADADLNHSTNQLRKSWPQRQYSSLEILDVMWTSTTHTRFGEQTQDWAWRTDLGWENHRHNQGN